MNKAVDLSVNYKPTAWYPQLWYGNGAPYSTHVFLTGAGYSFATHKHYNAGTVSSPNYVAITAGTPMAQKFANWYSYYRTRDMIARAGILKAFSNPDLLGKFRLGYHSINTEVFNNASNPTINPAANLKGVRLFNETTRANFFDWIKRPHHNGGTPLKSALNAAGLYYMKDEPWRDDPALSTSPKSLSCRKSVAILMTDGYWNADSLTSTTVDGPGTATTFTTPPDKNGVSHTWNKHVFRDNYTGTLADVAWKYWVTDLQGSLTNNVNTSTRDPAFWQHMTTFSVGLGVRPDIITNTESPFTAIDTGPTSTTGTPNSRTTFAWPEGKYHQIDDLLHAAVNGHGGFYSAADPDAFSAAIKAILNSVVGGAASSGKLGTNEAPQGAAGASAARNFTSSFKSDTWSGDLSSVEVSVITETHRNAIAALPEWSAAARLPAPGARRIFTRSDGSGITFNWANLNTTQKAELAAGNADPHGENVLAFLRGSSAREVANGGAFRNRFRAPPSASTLGDSPHNTPHYHAATKTVYQGANDGMLHAFDADTGIERFAYIPSALFPKLADLSHTDYVHAYYVDGEAVVANFAAASSYMLVGALGRGGKGLYGLDVTTPASFGAGDVKWEFNTPATCAATDSDNVKDLGLILGKPIITKLSSSTQVAIVGNGYNSCSGKAALYFINTLSGAVEQKVVVNGGPDNGLSTPFAYDANNDGIPDAIYAGDLNGNLWRFEEVAGTWQASFGGSAVPMLVARNPLDQIQPITAAPFAVKNETDGKLWVFFGTGQYLQITDKKNQQVQSLYGLIDDGSATIIHTDLKQRHFTAAGTGSFSDGTPVTLRYADRATAGDMDSFRGWYIDFDLASDKGERIVAPVRVARGGSLFVLEAMSNVPTTDPCEKGGRSNWILIDPFTGGELAFPVIDTNGDGKVDSGDKRNGRVPGSAGLGFLAGLPPPPDDLCKPYSATVGGMGGESAATGRGPIPGCGSSGIKGRVSWRELIN
ncbi:pilus biosynthesis protein [Betaproteobacteria bacterium]|nr:pilus biosynthesis protein [Betaproteobacteria bacterium]